ncbi:MAG: HAD family phosphatase [Clostridia bacterium]|nr:HAD family phosphatase [Clostridia bacterium]
MIRLIATDLDDTLLNERSDLNPRVIEALRAAMAAGCGIVLCSGRMLEAMQPLAERIGVNAPMLLYNGALAYDHRTDEVIFAEQLSYETALGIAELAEGMGFYLQAYPGRNYYCNEVCEHTLRYASYIHVDAIPVHKPVTEWMREHPSGMQKLLLIDTPEGATRAQAALREAFPTGASFLKSKPHYIEIVPEGVDKGRALLRLAGHLGVARDEVMAFGDGQNDVAMIEAAGTGVAMRNGCPEALRAADIIAPTNREDGVAQVIEDYLRQGKIGRM